jgi:putative flippase GtrA
MENPRKRQPSGTRQMPKLLKYFLAGGTSALVEWSLFWICNSRFGVHYFLAVAIAFFLATLVNYLLSAYFVFDRGQRTPSTEVLLVYIVSGIGFGLNFLLMWLLHGRLMVPAMPAKIASTGVVFFWNYFSRRRFIFYQHNGLESKK